MRRPDKEAFVSDFAEKIGSSSSFALLSFNKLTVEKMTEFRMSLGKQGVKVKVVKNTLARRVLQDTPYTDLIPHLKGITMVAYGGEDAVSMTKAVWDWVGKEDIDITAKAGMAMGQVLDLKQLEALSKLPGREELLTGFLWALNSAPTKFLYALQDAPRKLGYALGALKSKKEAS